MVGAQRELYMAVLAKDEDSRGVRIKQAEDAITTLYKALDEIEDGFLGDKEKLAKFKVQIGECDESIHNAIEYLKKGNIDEIGRAHV